MGAARGGGYTGMDSPRPPVLLVLLLACGPKVVTDTITDDGSVCVNDAGEVEVTFEACLSSSCDTVVSAECSATYADDVVEVHATAVIDREQGECTSDCGYVTVTCAMPEGVPDTATFSFGGESTPLDAACEPF